MPQKRYIVRLTAQEREVCRETVRKLNGSSEKVRRAQVLLKADADGPAWTDQKIADAFSCRTKTVENIRQRCVLEGFEPGAGAKTAGVPPGPQTAQRRAGGSHHRPASGAAPEGLRELVVAPAGAAGRRVGDHRVDQPRNHPADAKKNGMTQRKIQYWVIPPQADAEFVAHMEQVWICIRNPTIRIVPSCAWTSSRCSWSRKPARRWRPRRTVPGVSTTSTNGPARPRSSCSASRWRVGGRRPPGPGVRRWDWALEVAGLLEGRYADCEKITLVCDHLNTHTKGAFYQVFEPARARELVRRIEFCHTPKHGSWLNIAENELSSMTRQCVRGRRIGDLGRCTTKCRRGPPTSWHATRCRLADEGRRCAL